MRRGRDLDLVGMGQERRPQRSEARLKGEGVAALMDILKRIWQGKTLHRIMMEKELEKLSLRGMVLDLGAGTSEYARELSDGAAAQIVKLDLRIDCKPAVVADMEKVIPFKNCSFDCVLLFNVLEHIFDYQRVIDEAGRVLKDGGTMYLFVPFLFSVHRANYSSSITDDYFRFTDSALKKIIGKTGLFSNVTIIAYELGTFTAGVSQFLPALRFRVVKAVVLLLSTGLDLLYSSIRGFFRSHRPPAIAQTSHVIGYFAIAQKGPGYCYECHVGRA